MAAELSFVRFTRGSKNVTAAFLENRKSEGAARWVLFCKAVLRLNAGIDVPIHEAHTSTSKYIYLNKPGHPYLKMRFSDHKPNKRIEAMQDCHMYVGPSHGNLVGNSLCNAIWKVHQHFNVPMEDDLSGC